MSGGAVTRSAVVTGSGKGIGRAIAERLTADGWIVVGLERTAGSGSVEDGACAEVVLGDASERGAHERAAAAAARWAAPRRLGEQRRDHPAHAPARPG
ncbi:hypothetical protein [Microbacterium resistens]|uniref:hypothetical protein n=1 Tax=Microbacterium resistens TaxID=156977 RepID=UPI00082DC6E0|nr:hypothetical protein [Microbacterium resistens]